MNTAEREFIGRLICFQDKESPFFVERIKEHDFADEDNREIFIAIRNIVLRGSEVNIWSVCKDLDREDRGDWVPKVAESMVGCNYSDLKESAKALKEETIARKIGEFKLTGRTDGISEELHDLYAELSQLDNLEEVYDSSFYLETAINDRISPKGPATGFDKIDDNSKCLKKGHFWVIGGYTNTGKTQFSLQVAEQLRCKFSFISMEMDGGDIMERILKIKMSHSLLEDKAMEEIIKNPFEIPTHLIQIHEIEKYILENNFEVVFIDFIQLVQGGGKLEYERMSNVSTRLQALAKRSNTCIVALSQVSEEFQKNKSFQTLGFKGSGGIASACDMGIILTRDVNNESNDRIVPFQVSVRKNRHGRTGKFEFCFDTFTGMIRDHSVLDI